MQIIGIVKGYPDHNWEAILTLASMIFLLPFVRFNGMVFRLCRVICEIIFVSNKVNVGSLKR